jgi:hypothetical protein
MVVVAAIFLFPIHLSNLEHICLQPNLILLLRQESNIFENIFLICLTEDKSDGK